MQTLIVCLGNERVCDDGIAAVVGRILSALPLPPEVAVKSLPRLCFDVLDDIATAEQLLVVDALATGAQPGACSVVDVTPVPSAMAASECNHQASVNQILDLARYVACDGGPRNVAIAGVEGRQAMRYGARFSDEVLAAVPTLVDLILLFVGARVEARTMVKEVCRRLLDGEAGLPGLCTGGREDQRVAV